MSYILYIYYLYIYIHYVYIYIYIMYIYIYVLCMWHSKSPLRESHFQMESPAGHGGCPRRMVA